RARSTRRHPPRKTPARAVGCISPDGGAHPERARACRLGRAAPLVQVAAPQTPQAAALIPAAMGASSLAAMEFAAGSWLGCHVIGQFLAAVHAKAGAYHAHHECRHHAEPC